MEIGTLYSSLPEQLIPLIDAFSAQMDWNMGSVIMGIDDMGLEYVVPSKRCCIKSVAPGN